MGQVIAAVWLDEGQGRLQALFARWKQKDKTLSFMVGRKSLLLPQPLAEAAHGLSLCDDIHPVLRREESPGLYKLGKRNCLILRIQNFRVQPAAELPTRTWER